jgi:DNA-binding response OmpR family regulator
LSLRLILEREGYGVAVFESVAAFERERRAGRTDLYLVDVRLPDWERARCAPRDQAVGDPGRRLS